MLNMEYLQGYAERARVGLTGEAKRLNASLLAIEAHHQSQNVTPHMQGRSGVIDFGRERRGA